MVRNAQTPGSASPAIGGTNGRGAERTDGNAAMTDAEHAASLIAFYLTFGDIMPTDMLIDCLRRNAGGKLRAGAGDSTGFQT